MQFGMLIVTLVIFGLMNLFGSDAAPSPYGYRRHYDYRYEKRDLCPCTTNNGKGTLFPGKALECPSRWVLCGSLKWGACCIPPPPPPPASRRDFRYPY